VSWIFIVLAHWNNSPWIDSSLHSDTLFWFRANQSLFLLRYVDNQEYRYCRFWTILYIYITNQSYTVYHRDSFRIWIDHVNINVVLAHWNNSPWIDISLHSDTLFWFRANLSLFLLLNAACLAEKHTLIYTSKLTYTTEIHSGYESTMLT
jgi:hypothetical protein